MKKIFFALIGCLTVVCAHAAQIANIEYVHKMIEHKWDITVPYNPTLSNVKSMANMKYLLTAIDVANEILNGEPTTNYGDGEFATLQVADTTATNQAVDTLVRKEDKSPKFFLTTTSTNSFSFKISAAGKFYVDWGDGTIETINKTNTTNTTYSHTYSTSKSYTIGIGGQATAYNTSTSTAAISFYVNSSQTKIASIDGSLGAIFGTLSSDTNNQPRFYQTFCNATNMTGSIPSDLFAGISGAPASSMFNQTFYRCSGLTGEIPENLFGNISGPAQSSMFSGTFYNCTSLTGPSARINGQYLYEIWPDATYEGYNMYFNATGLSDYPYIPVTWGGLGATTNEYPSAPSDAVYDFYLTTTSDTDVFAMQISAAGEFYIDWGDSKTEWVTKSDTTNMTFGHKYASKGVYNIRLGGQATAYSTSTNTAAISFYIGPSTGAPWMVIQTKIASIDGSLGAIFGTLSSDTNNQPRFYRTFDTASNMTGSIPENLFAGISGAPASYMFDSAFKDCSGLTGAIPDGLFAGISGAPARDMFADTFNGCSGLTGAIPDGLFGNLSGAPAAYMFNYTFYNCSGLTSIPENLFGNISGTAQGFMFSGTFYNCTSLTGPSARINGQYLYEIWPSATSHHVGDMYYNATGLSDYSSIPDVWK